jgi:hypothetical protein
MNWRQRGNLTPIWQRIPELSFSAEPVADWMTAPSRRVATLLCLSRALKGEPSGIGKGAGYRQPISWSEVIALASELLVTPCLWSAVAHLDDDMLRAPVAEELRDHYRANTIRNLRLRHQLTGAVQALNAAGIVPMLFKGALVLVDGQPGGLGDRFMSDLDVVVPTGGVSRAVEALQPIGFRQVSGKPFQFPHEVPLVHRGVWTELHVELGSAPIPAVLPAAEVWSESTDFIFGQGRAHARAPSATHQVLHNVLHSAVQDLEHAVAGLPLRQLVTLTRLVRVHGSSVDWTAVGQRMQAHGLTNELRDYLWLAHRLAGMPLPDGRYGTIGSRSHEARVLASFGLRWPPELQRNLRFAFRREYLDTLYSHGNRPSRLVLARARHAVRVLRQDGRGALHEAVQRKV